MRVLVNGIRGKSTVTRLIAAGLRAGGIRTVAKTTGSAARLILPDGTEEEIPRVAPNVSEQIGIVHQAAAYRPQALVVECMAVEPELQWAMQHKLVRATVGVITNVRADHLQEMGPTLEDVALSLSTTAPQHGALFTCERDYFPLLQRAAHRRASLALQVTPDRLAREGARRFPYVTFPDNVALALAVCEHLGVPRQVALEGMLAAAPDPGVIQVHAIPLAQGEALFVNLLAANDPDSTLIATQLVNYQMNLPQPTVFLLNCRPDRVERSQQLGEMIGRRLSHEADCLVLVGGPTQPAVRAALNAGYPADRILDLGERFTSRVVSLFEHTARALQQRRGQLPSRFTVVGIGNIHGFGHEITAFLQTLDTAWQPALSPYLSGSNGAHEELPARRLRRLVEAAPGPQVAASNGASHRRGYAALPQGHILEMTGHRRHDATGD
jgi:poly-gamma-glutamate synthase PgsB/CapB